MNNDNSPMLRQFDFEGHPIRIEERNGKEWFVHVDVCRALGHSNPSKAARGLKDNEKGLTIGATPGGPQKLLIVNEPGLYRLIFLSRLSAAETFKDWVVETVLPAIRKHGGYVAGQEKLATGEMSREEYLARAVTMAQSVIDELKPKAERLDRFVSADGFVSFTDVARQIGVPHIQLIENCIADRLIFRRNRNLIAYQQHINSGLLAQRAVRRRNSNDVVTHAYVTPRGVDYLAQKYAA